MKNEDLDPLALGREIARIRDSKGWSQPALGKVAGVGMSTIQRIEAGGNPRLQTLLDVCDALDVRLSCVLSGTMGGD